MFAGEAAAEDGAVAVSAAGDGYDIDAMTFVAEEEVIPTIAAVKAAEEAAAAVGTSKNKKVRLSEPAQPTRLITSCTGLDNAAAGLPEQSLHHCIMKVKQLSCGVDGLLEACCSMLWCKALVTRER
jgi:hypothetical protein